MREFEGRVIPSGYFGSAYFGLRQTAAERLQIGNMITKRSRFAGIRATLFEADSTRITARFTKVQLHPHFSENSFSR